MAHFTLSMDPAVGPVISALVGVSHSRRDALMAAERSVPAPISIRALIDTGASHTCVDSSVIRALQVSPTQTVQIHTPSTGAEPHTSREYDISLVVPGAVRDQAPLTIAVTPVVATELVGTGVQALIGRDILGACMLLYNGSYGQFSLAF